jgi:hypothetical protein
MERVFYPSSKKFFRQKYIQPAISALLIGFIFGVVNAFHGGWPVGFILLITLVAGF